MEDFLEMEVVLVDFEHVKILMQGVEVWNKWREENPEIGQSCIYKADLSKVSLREANLQGIDLSFTNLYGVNLSGSNLNGANFSRANLREVNLSGANLSRANLREVNLSGINLSGAELSEADLSNSNLRGANLSGANLSGSNLSGADFRYVSLGSTEGGSHANITNAKLLNIKLNDENDSFFFELATAKGIESTTFQDDQFLKDYLEKAFNQAINPKHAARKDWPDLVDTALERIKALRALYKGKEPPSQLVEVISFISAEFIKYLSAHPKALYRLKPRQFERLVAEILYSFGWEIQLTPESKDGGYDIFAVSKEINQKHQAWFIECKKYSNENKVGVEILRELYGTRTLIGNHDAYLMLATTSSFTKGAKDIKASRYDLKLKDYKSIIEWINKYRKNPRGELYLKDNNLVMRRS